jgi:fucose permease
VIGLSLEHRGTIQPAYWALGLLALPVVLVLLGMRSPRPEMKAVDEEKDAIDYPLVGFVCLLFFLCVGSQAGFSGWIYTYAVKLELASELQAAYLTSSYWLAQTTGLLLSIPLLLHLRPQTVLVGVLTIGLLGLVLMLSWPNTVATWIGTFGLGMGIAPLFPAAFAYIGQRMPISGKVNGWFLAGASVGAMSIPWVAGQVVESMGPRSVMLVFTIMMSLAYLLLLAFLACSRP